MANFVVFLDHSHANIFELHPEMTEEHHMVRHELKKHMGAEKEQNKHKDERKFFDDLIVHLKDAHQILLIGPGLAKTEFKHHLETHHHKAVNDKVVAVETVDHPTDGQIVAMGKKFFKNHLKFE